MALVKCYDSEGNEHLKESVDLRECISQCGYTLEPVEPKVEEVALVQETGTGVTQPWAK